MKSSFRPRLVLAAAAAAIALAGCAGGGSSGAPYTPTAVMVGDSISESMEGDIKDDLKDQITVSHACGDHGGGHCNNGDTRAILANMHAYFRNGDADIVTFNSGVHDFSFNKATMPGESCADRGLRVPPSQYYDNLTKIADYIARHSRVAIWVDTTTVEAKGSCISDDDRKGYNALAEVVARNHHFYILQIKSQGHAKDGIHFTYAGYRFLAQQVSDCIITAWTNQETAACNLTGG